MPVTHALLSRRPARPTPTYPLLPGADELSLHRGRVHEVCGTARRTFALWLAAQTDGPVLWIAPQWEQVQLNGDGIRSWANPARLLFVTPGRVEDLLWSTEQALRAGAVALVVADLPTIPGLTAVRRMHLAAENGADLGQHIPLGLLLTPGEGGAPGVETRWKLGGSHGDGQERWQLHRLRARSAPHKIWDIHRPTPQAPPQIKTA